MIYKNNNFPYCVVYLV